MDVIAILSIVAIVVSVITLLATLGVIVYGWRKQRVHYHVWSWKCSGGEEFDNLNEILIDGEDEVLNVIYFNEPDRAPEATRGYIFILGKTIKTDEIKRK